MTTALPVRQTDPGGPALRPCCDAEDLLVRHDGAITRIRISFGIDGPSFESQILPIILRLAQYVLNLPATRDAYYHHPGGMFEFALRVGFFTLQGTDAYIFAGRSTISVRRQLEPRWRLATFLAGLLVVLERTAGRASVEDDGGCAWPALVTPLGPWFESRGATGYRLAWRSEALDVSGIGLLALPLVVPAETLQYLSEDNEEVLPALLASVAGLARFRDHNPLPKLVRRAFALVVHEWTVKSSAVECAEAGEAYLQRSVLDAIRRLAASHPHWSPNREKSRVWVANDGIYLVWPPAAADIAGSFDEDELAGMPRSAEAILGLLDGAGAVLPGSNPPNPLWLIQPPNASGPLEAIKLTSSAVLFPFSAHQPVPLDGSLAVQRPDTAPTAVRVRPGTGDQLDLGLADAPAPMIRPDTATPAKELGAGDGVTSGLNAGALRLPLRLDRSVAEALDHFLGQLDGTHRQGLLSSEGLFVPYSCFAARGLLAPVAVAAMDTAGMLARGSDRRPRTVRREISGTVEVGVIISTRFLDAN